MKKELLELINKLREHATTHSDSKDLLYQSADELENLIEYVDELLERLEWADERSNIYIYNQINGLKDYAWTKED